MEPDILELSESITELRKSIEGLQTSIDNIGLSELASAVEKLAVEMYHK